MTCGCFNLAALRDGFLRRTFECSGLRSATTDLTEATMHCWVPKNATSSKPDLILIHGLGSSATWQWNEVVPTLSRHFNLYVPDLVFFGDSRTSSHHRSEAFQARCVAAVVGSHGVRSAYVAGISYGGFVAYQLASQFPNMVEKVVVCCAGICMDDDDMASGMFSVRTVDEVVSLLLPQTPAQARKLIDLSFYRPIRGVPSCFLRDFIQFMCTDYLQERKELIQALHKDRKISSLPKITQPTLIIWGEHDAVFPIELGHRLKRHIDGNSELVIIKNAGHALNAEKPKELCKYLKSFLIGPLQNSKQVNGNHSISNTKKVD